jgi:acetyl esterase
VIRSALVAARRRTGRAAITLLLEGGTRLLRLHPRGRALRAGLEITRDVAYDEGARAPRLLDVWRPAGARAPLPVLLHVHGGGFRILSKEASWAQAAAFARAGHAVFTLDYRLAPRHPFPAALEDACRAALWVREHAAEHGGDPSRWALAGESAGANLVLALAIAATGPRPEPWARAVFEADLPIRACLPACGLLQVSQGERFRERDPGLPVLFADRIHEVCRGYLGSQSEPGSLADPLLVLESDWEPARAFPPTLAIVGSRDPVLDDSLRLGRALERRGLPGGVRLFEGGGHAFHLVPWTPLGRAAWAAQLAFLDERLREP